MAPRSSCENCEKLDKPLKRLDAMLHAAAKYLREIRDERKLARLEEKETRKERKRELFRPLMPHEMLRKKAPIEEVKKVIPGIYKSSSSIQYSNGHLVDSDGETEPSEHEEEDAVDANEEDLPVVAETSRVANQEVAVGPRVAKPYFNPLMSALNISGKRKRRMPSHNLDKEFEEIDYPYYTPPKAPPRGPRGRIWKRRQQMIKESTGLTDSNEEDDSDGVRYWGSSVSAPSD